MKQHNKQANLEQRIKLYDQLMGRLSPSEQAAYVKPGSIKKSGRIKHGSKRR